MAKRYVEERGSELVDHIYSEAETGRIQIAFSTSSVGEVLGVLDRYRARSILSERDFRTVFRHLALESMKLLRLGSLIMHPITSDVIVQSWVAVMDSHIYQADALQIASAKALGCDLFLAADQKLLEAARSRGLQSFNVETEAIGVRKALEA